MKEARQKKKSIYCMIPSYQILENTNQYIVTETDRWLPRHRVGWGLGEREALPRDIINFQR